MPRRLLPWQHGATTHGNPSGEVSRSPGASAGGRPVFDVAPVVTMSVRPARSPASTFRVPVRAGLVDRGDGIARWIGRRFALPASAHVRTSAPGLGWSPGTGARAGAGLLRIPR